VTWEDLTHHILDVLMTERSMGALDIWHGLVVQRGVHKFRDVFTECIDTWDHITGSFGLKLRSKFIELRPSQLFLRPRHASIWFPLHLYLWLLIVNPEVWFHIFGNRLLQYEFRYIFVLFINPTGFDHVQGIETRLTLG
jgi:hypothetical protein